MNVIQPNNNSLSVFLKVWRPCLFGSIRYFFRHGLSSVPAFWNRLKFSVFKISVSKPFQVPEGILICSNQEMITHSAMFIEETLYNKELCDELTNTTSGRVIDVGACYGMFTAWVNSKTKSGITFSCFEPYYPFFEKGKKNTSTAWSDWRPYAVSDKDGECKMYREDNALVTFHRPVHHIETSTVQCVKLDSFVFGDVLVLKIDTDGHNSEVLAGAVETLNRTQYVLIEKEDGLDINKWFPSSEWSMLPLKNSDNDYLFKRRIYK